MSESAAVMAVHRSLQLYLLLLLPAETRTSAAYEKHISSEYAATDKRR